VLKKQLLIVVQLKIGAEESVKWRSGDKPYISSPAAVILPQHSSIGAGLFFNHFCTSFTFTHEKHHMIAHPCYLM